MRAAEPAGHAGPAPGRAKELAQLERLADLLDARYRIPGLGIRFGWDAILGLVPGLGDAATALPAIYLIHRAHRMGAPRGMLARMGLNVALDTVVGSIPLLGSLFDIYFKASRRNAQLLRRHLEDAAP